jgi:hypothetical protein
MSPPAQKAFSPAASITSMATASSAAQASSAASIRLHISQVSAFSAPGRLSVIRPARPSTRIRMSSSMLAPDPLHLSKNTHSDINRPAAPPFRGGAPHAGPEFPRISYGKSADFPHDFREEIGLSRAPPACFAPRSAA